MEATSVESLAALADQVDATIAPLLRAGLDTVGDADAVEILAVGGRLLRLVEGLLIESVSEVMSRSESGDRDGRLSTRFGCHDVSELVQRTTRVSAQTASRLQRSTRATRCETSLVSGEKLSAALPAIRDALLDGVVGVDGVLAVSAHL